MSLFQFIPIAMLDTLSDLIFVDFDLSMSGSLINGKTCINFHISYAIELIYFPFFTKFWKLRLVKKFFLKQDCFYYFIYLTVISFIQSFEWNALMYAHDNFQIFTKIHTILSVRTQFLYPVYFHLPFIIDQKSSRGRGPFLGETREYHF